VIGPSKIERRSRAWLTTATLKGAEHSWTSEQR
jgi:hypothetical protein